MTKCRRLVIASNAAAGLCLVSGFMDITRMCVILVMARIITETFDCHQTVLSYALFKILTVLDAKVVTMFCDTLAPQVLAPSLDLAPSLSGQKPCRGIEEEEEGGERGQ